jgi:hypothetical protein
MKYNFPRQAISWRKKTLEWCKDCIKYADANAIFSSSTVRASIAHKKLNYDLLNGKLDMNDLMAVLNPSGFKFEREDMFKPIPHYPIVNRCIDVLVGEESASQLDLKAIITNPTAISEKENIKKQQILQSMQQLVADESLSEEDYQQKLQELSKYYTYEYQDIRELRANELLNHYDKEQDYKDLFIDGFQDALAVNEAIFQVTLEQGNPVLRKLNPCKVRVYCNGSSNRVEDADMVVVEDYWQVGRIIDVYNDKLTAKDIRFLEDTLKKGHGDKGERRYNDYGDRVAAFLYGNQETINAVDNGSLCFDDGITFNQLPYDLEGNIRVLQVYWKSLRKIQEITFYDEVTGKKDIKFETEDYIPDEDKGEESKIRWINEAWHGIMIGAGDDAIYVDCGPCEIQYNRLNNPSKCHFGIIGQIFNINESKPYSIVDKIKPFAYLYDAIMDKFVKTIQNNLGKLVQFNEAMMPDKWHFEDWVYYAKTAGIVLVNPMKEGNKGAAKNKLAGAFQVPPVIDAELGNSLQHSVNMLQYIEQTLCNMLGITPQRLGSIQNRETVGGVERSTLQSSHVTRWYFEKYNNLKKRVYECVLDTAKFGAKGKNLKFQYITSDLAQKVSEIDGDEFAEADYGLVISTDYDIEKFRQEVDQAATMALQSGTISFSSYLKMKSSGSLSEKIKMLEQNEQEMRQIQQQQQQQQLQSQQQQSELQLQLEQAKLQLQDQMNQRDNETRILTATIQAQSKRDADGDGYINEANNKQVDLNEQIRQFNEKMKLEKDKLQQDDRHHKEDNDLKLKIASMKPKTTTTKK